MSFDAIAKFLGTGKLGLSALPQLIELLSRAPERPKLERVDSGLLRGSLGPWRIEQTADGFRWDVVDEWKLQIWERFQWRPRPLTSKKKKGVARILLIGESAAGSFGYGEDYNLGACIEGCLNAAAGATRFEVVDLTCVNASWGGQCLEAVRHGMTLDPDLVIVYCGNNESKAIVANLKPGLVTENPYAHDARWSFDQADPAKTVEALNRCLEFHIKNLVIQTVHTCRASGVPVGFVVPEFNLGDWRPVEKLPYHLPNDKMGGWWEAIRAADEQLTAGKADAALKGYRRAIDIDGGMCQRSQFGAGRALLSLGRAADAYPYLLRARDAGLGPFIDAMPGTTTASAAAMRATFQALSIPFVDSPELFRVAAASGVPDRELFIDYCHLSPRGHEVLARAVAKMVYEDFARAHGVKAKRSPDVSAVPSPKPREAALGAIVGALHCHNFDQDLEIVKHWFTEAHRAWKGSRPILEFLADNVCTSFRESWTVERLEDAGFLKGLPVYYRFFLARCFYHARFDPELREVLEDILGRPEAVRRKSFETQTRNLLSDLDFRIHSRFFLDRHKGLATTTFRASRHGWERPALEIIATEPEGKILFPWDHVGPAVLELELEPLKTPARLEVLCDDTVCERVELTRGFQRIRVALPALGKGLHEIALRFDTMRSLGDLKDVEERRDFIEHYGYYPIAARIFASWIRPEEDRAPKSGPSKAGKKASAKGASKAPVSQRRAVATRGSVKTARKSG